MDIMAHPAKELQNIRKEREIKGAHMDIKLIGRNGAKGSMKAWKYPHLRVFARVKWIKINVKSARVNGTI